MAGLDLRSRISNTATTMHTPLRIGILSVALFVIGASAASAALTATTVCPTSGELRDKSNTCPFGYERYIDALQCQNVRCKEHGTRCLLEEEKELERQRCKAQGREPQTRFDGLCDVITCDEQATAKEVGCTKTVTLDDCTVINCTDGFSWNSCRQRAACPTNEAVKCREYTDNEGCQVRICKDRPKSRECPKNLAPSDLTCATIKREVGGILVKKCSDGTYIRTRTIDDVRTTPRGVKPIRRLLQGEVE